MNTIDHSAHEAPWNEPLDERERELMDPDFWDESTTFVGKPIKDLGWRLVLDVEHEDLRTLSAGAEAADMPITKYILHVALEAAKRVQPTSSHDRKKGVA